MNITDEYILEVFKIAKEVFCNGIYVPVKDWHPCGWDFISFEDIDLVDGDIFNYIFEHPDISNGIYDYHPYENMTLRGILTETKCRFTFEISGTDEF
jgi:hypothetical protein